MPIKNRFRVLLAEKELQEGRTISLRQVARETGLSLYTVNGFANSNLKAIPVDALNTLCAYLECSPGDMLTREPEVGNNRPLLLNAA
jgi:DNA-binding Xre family transcriptional regulator